MAVTFQVNLPSWPTVRAIEDCLSGLAVQVPATFPPLTGSAGAEVATAPGVEAGARATHADQADGRPTRAAHGHRQAREARLELAWWEDAAVEGSRWLIDQA